MKAPKKRFLEGNQINQKKYAVFFTTFLLHVGFIFSQSESYDNFEGKRSLHYMSKSGVLDTTAKNPAPDKINSSEKCALYVRNRGQKFDNIKMSINGKLSDVAAYTTYAGIPPKIKMKIYTKAPVGTLVEVLLGSKGRNSEYPAGTNSQYQAYTTVSGVWEELEFKFSQVPQGSEISSTEVDQITLLFNANSSTSDTYYFDDIKGPSVISGKLEATTPTKESK